MPGLRGVDYVALAGELYGLPRKQAIRRAHEVLTYLQLEDARYRRLEEYSTGMKQRLKLAQSLVHDPPVLLARRADQRPRPGRPRRHAAALLELGRDFGKSLIVSHAPAGRRRSSLRAGGDPDGRPGPRAGLGRGVVRSPQRPVHAASAGRRRAVPLGAGPGGRARAQLQCERRFPRLGARRLEAARVLRARRPTRARWCERCCRTTRRWRRCSCGRHRVRRHLETPDRDCAVRG